ncbi:site-specific recombinase [Undibacterium sp. Jales W-56]|uniref:site-specific recombinase n=1 Tax=Undibacterium sp. Jales W-56 TaxID=2897325 RepID=UPI0021CF37F9|nr:site-specific recombinase [Undibacterium sp. Jales W-56]MCU6435681.1 site-specific recombinase [Undibacterium sp. Jales W-56]
MSIDSTLSHIVEARLQDPEYRDIHLLRELIASLRPTHHRKIEQATDNIRALCYVLRQHPAWSRELREYIACVLTTRKTVHLLTDTGITQNVGFWTAASQRIAEKFLPPLVNDDYIKDVFGQLFDRNTDHHWVDGVADTVWLDLFKCLGFKVSNPRTTYAALTQEVLSAIQVLSYRITTIGLEAELVRNYPDIEKFESPFLRQNDAINDYVTQYSNWLIDKKSEREDSLHIEVLLTQCEEVVQKIRKVAALQGVSVSLTRLLLRLTQSIRRLRTMLGLLDSRSSGEASEIGVGLLKELVLADNKRSSIRDLIQTNTELLSLQMTERAGKSGEHYVTSNRSEWLAMMRSALGAGFIVGFMATIKILFGKLILAPFGYAVLYSLNYSFGFMLVHVLHMTIATKQPAMTAALIAKSIDQGKQKLDELVELIVRVLRSQFIAIIGNVALAIPTAYAIAWAWYAIHGQHLVTPDKAHHLLEDIDPFHSLALPHAAIAGVCLFLSGLISGYYDNKASYSNIPARLRQLSWLRKLLGEQRLQRTTDYIGDNLGALAGNFFFGVMLGTIGQLGAFFGLPIDIRHITFSSANFAFALVGLDQVMSWQVVATSLGGIILIGLVNLGVSFSLAMMVALRSRRVSFGRGNTLNRLLWRRFISGTRDFFLPPKDLPVETPEAAATSTEKANDKPSH